MKANYIMVDGNIYLVKGKIIIKYFDSSKGYFRKITSEERKLVECKLLRNQNGHLFKSPMLNLLAEENSELKSIDLFEEILDDIEKEIPKEYRETFYNNLRTLKISIEYSYSKKRFSTKDEIVYSVPASYTTTTNEINIYLRDIKDFKKAVDNPQAKDNVVLDTMGINFHDYLKRIFIHELQHLSSTNIDEENDQIYSGLCVIDKEENEMINNSLNEAMSEIKSRRIFQNESFDNNMGYKLQVCIIKQLIDLIGYDIFEKSYYENKSTELIEEELLKIINDELKVNTLLYVLENDNAGSLNKQNIQTLSLIQAIILEYYEKKINDCFESGSIEEIGKAVRLFDNLEKNFVNIVIDGEYQENEFTIINLDRIHRLQEKRFCNHSYKRKQSRSRHQSTPNEKE